MRKTVASASVPAHSAAALKRLACIRALSVLIWMALWFWATRPITA